MSTPKVMNLCGAREYTLKMCLHSSMSRNQYLLLTVTTETKHSNPVDLLKCDFILLSGHEKDVNSTEVIEDYYILCTCGFFHHIINENLKETK